MPESQPSTTALANTRACQNCRQDTEHRQEPVTHPLSPDAVAHTCVACGFTTTHIPHIDTLDIHVTVHPSESESTGIIIKADRVTIDDQPFEAHAPFAIRLGNTTILQMNNPS